MLLSAMDTPRPMRLALWSVLTLLVALDAETRADDGCTFCASRSRADGRAGVDTIPDSGTASATIRGEGARVDGSLAGFTALSLLLGTPYYSAFEVELPLVLSDGRVGAGSATIAVLAHAGLELPRANVLKLGASAGVAFPSLDAAPMTVGLLRPSAESLEFRGRVGTTLITPSRFSLSLQYQREGAGHELGGTVGYVSSSAIWSIHVGMTVALEGTDRYWGEGAASVRPRWAPRWSLALYGAVPPLEPAHAVAGLSLSYSFPVLHHSPDPGEHYLGTNGTAEVVRPRPRDGRYPLSDFAIAGRVTIVAFKAWWCTACRELEPDLRRLASNKAVTIVFLDEGDLEDLFSYNGGRGIPLVVVFNAGGIEVGRTANDMDVLSDLLDRALDDQCERHGCSPKA